MPPEQRGPGQWRARSAQKPAHRGRRYSLQASVPSSGANPVVAKECEPSLKLPIAVGRLQRESCCPQPDRGNPAVRDDNGGRRKRTEARNEAPAISDKEPDTATPRCPPALRLCSIQTFTIRATWE